MKMNTPFLDILIFGKGSVFITQHVTYNNVLLEKYFQIIINKNFFFENVIITLNRSEADNCSNYVLRKVT